MSLVSDQPVVLSVPFADKERAKKVGAKPFFENRQFRYWFAPPGKDLTPFADWLPATWAIQIQSENPPAAVDGEAPVRPSVSLSQLLGSVKAAIESSGISGMWVMAEISEFKCPGHAYLDLVEYDASGAKVAQVRGMIWKQNVEKALTGFVKDVGAEPGPGMKILAKVAPRFSESYGLSLDILEIDPRCTMGDMERKTREIIEKLKKEGVYDHNRSLPTPRDFFHVAVISPSQAAGLGDFMTKADVLKQAGVCDFTYYTATFQGNDSERSLIKAMDQALSSDDIDALIVIRGGGAKAGLYELNTETLARAVCCAAVPVITGIGHEQDSTILDDVACLRCATPSMVIAYIMDAVVGNARAVRDAKYGLETGAQRLIARARDQITGSREQLFWSAQSQTSVAREDLNEIGRSLIHGAQLKVEEARSQLGQLMQALVYQDPNKIIARGYGVVRQGGQVVGCAEQIENGKPLTVTLRDGVVHASVESKEMNHE